MTDRRQFLKLATSGAVAAGMLGATGVGAAGTNGANGGSATSPTAPTAPTAPAQSSGASFLGGVNARGATPGSVSDPEERRRLIGKGVFGAKEPASGAGGMVICAHPLATRAGTDVLRAGGNAADAVLCASVTQTVVEPHMTGVTGVLSMLYYDAATGETSYVNGGMNAPLAPLVGWGPTATATGLGAGVPGFWAGYEASLARHGSKPSKELCAAAIAYARDGFEIHPFLWGEMFSQSPTLGVSETGREIFFPHGGLANPGEMLYQKRAADTLERLAEEGNSYFYFGDFARQYSEVVQAAGGVITREDFEHYDVRFDEPARGSYRGYDLVGSPPPDNGGTHIIEILQILENVDIEKLGPPTESAETMWQMARATDLVFTDGAKQPDPESHPLPLDLITSKEYAKIRFELLQMGRPIETPQYQPPGSCHVTAVDAAGNVATVLHSCMSLPWSNGLFAAGVTIVASGAHFFRIMPKPGHRASVYVAPNMVMKDGRPVLASGSPSVSLLQNVVQNTSNMIDFGIPIHESVNRPRFGNSYGAAGSFPAVEVDLDETVRDAAIARGLPLVPVNQWNWGMGSFEGIWIDPDSGERTGRGDPRRCAMVEAE
ncbi:MAG: gamma-glutamyltransferase [Acidobacteria bacterium]|nr:gamma-glutamyltransferase [Acidobacteriota bacterium]